MYPKHTFNYEGSSDFNIIVCKEDRQAIVDSHLYKDNLQKGLFVEINSYFTFLLIAFGYIASSGPAVFIAINGGASLGKKETFFLLFGNTVGLGIIALISTLGVGSLILKSSFQQLLRLSERVGYVI